MIYRKALRKDKKKLRRGEKHRREIKWLMVHIQYVNKQKLGMLDAY